MAADNLAQVGRRRWRVVGLEPVEQRGRGRVDREAVEVDVLVAVAGVGPVGVGGAVGHRQADRRAHVVVGIPQRIGECAGIGVEGLVGDAEIGAEGLAAVGADRAEDVEEFAGRVAAGVVPDNGNVALGVGHQLGQGLAIDNVVQRPVEPLAAIVIVEHVGGLTTDFESRRPVYAVIGGSRENDVSGVDHGP